MSCGSFHRSTLVFFSMLFHYNVFKDSVSVSTSCLFCFHGDGFYLKTLEMCLVIGFMLLCLYIIFASWHCDCLNSQPFVFTKTCFFLEHFAFPFAHNTLTKWIFKYSVHFGQWGKELQHFPYHISAVFYQHTHKCEQAHAHKIIPTSLPEICSYRPDILLCLRLHWQCFIATLEACLTYKRHTDLHMTINVGNFLQQRLIQVDW